MITIFKNVRIITPDTIRPGAVIVRDDRIDSVTDHFTAPEGAKVYDGQNLYLSPGFIDLHAHGGGGHSVMEGTAQAIRAIADAHARFGTTSILPTTLSMDDASLARAAQAIVDAMRAGDAKATILGIHFEGPFLSPRQAGAQAPDTLRLPCAEIIAPLMPFLPQTRMMGIAPELDGALALGERLAARGVVVSIAHSDATYDEVAAATRHGFSDVTHLYSGCSTVVRRGGFRMAGVVEAGLEMEALTTQVIADGRHLPPALLRLIYRCKGAQGMYAITDALEYAAYPMQEGAAYVQQNGQPAVYEDGVMKLPDRSAFAGSVATMHQTVRVLRDAGIPLAEAVSMATSTPAARIGAARKGRIAPGYDADLVLHDDAIVPKLCMAGGVVLYDAKVSGKTVGMDEDSSTA